MDRKYVLIVRTGEAEIRAVENLEDEVFDEVLPLIELTRGRKRTIDDMVSYPFDLRLSKLKNKLKGRQIAMDVTSDENLASEETDSLYNFENGYEKWVQLLLNLKDENVFSSIIPSLVMNYDDDNFEENFKKEIHSLLDAFGVVLYRCAIEDEDCYDDLDLIRHEIGDKKLFVLIDCGYMAQAMQHNVAEKCKARIRNIRSLLSCNYDIIICGTSFPNNISEIGNDDTDIFRVSEVDVFEACHEIYDKVVYGDYGSINPKRNDGVVMARGWIPRIDVPLEENIYYYRLRRPSKVSRYSSTYEEVAKLVMKDRRFPHHLKVWGTDMIRQCAYDKVPSSSPSFWISVRMNIHVMQQLNRLKRALS